jgi:hypothetical protein
MTKGPRLGGDGAVARRQDPQHALRHLHADVDEGRIAGGVEPERPVQPLGERPAQGLVDGRGEQGVAAPVRQGLAGLQRHRKVHEPLGALL